MRWTQGILQSLPELLEVAEMHRRVSGITQTQVSQELNWPEARYGLVERIEEPSELLQLPFGEIIDLALWVSEQGHESAEFEPLTSEAAPESDKSEDGPDYWIETGITEMQSVEAVLEEIAKDEGSRYRNMVVVEPEGDIRCFGLAAAQWKIGTANFDENVKLSMDAFVTAIGGGMDLAVWQSMRS